MLPSRSWKGKVKQWKFVEGKLVLNPLSFLRSFKNIVRNSHIVICAIHSLYVFSTIVRQLFAWIGSFGRGQAGRKRETEIGLHISDEVIQPTGEASSARLVEAEAEGCLEVGNLPVPHCWAKEVRPALIAFALQPPASQDHPITCPHQSRHCQSLHEVMEGRAAYASRSPSSPHPPRGNAGAACRPTQPGTAKGR